MRTVVPEKILKVIADVESQGNVPLTRLTVLKKWFEQRPGRMPAFGLWVARRAAGRKGKTKGEAGALLDEARALCGPGSTRDSVFQRIAPDAARKLHDRARGFQNRLQNQPGGPVRIIECWPLLLVEKGLALHAGLETHPTGGYQLAADWAQNYDPRLGTGLNGPSRGKLDELVRFMFGVEALEDDDEPLRG